MVTTRRPGRVLRVEIGAQPLARLTAALEHACDLVTDPPGPGVVVVRLAGTDAGTDADAAGTGADGGRWPGAVDVTEVSRWERAVRRLERLPAPTVAVAAGRCGGAAFDVLLAADHRIAAAGMRLCLARHDGVPWPGMALHRLANQLGTAPARRLLLDTRDLGARAALALGLVDEVTEDPDHAVGMAHERLGRLCGTEWAIRRQLLSEAVSTDFEDALGAHLAACDRELRRRSGG